MLRKNVAVEMDLGNDLKNRGRSGVDETNWLSVAKERLDVVAGEKVLGVGLRLRAH